MENAHEEQQIREEYNIWKNNVHLLYYMFPRYCCIDMIWL